MRRIPPAKTSHGKSIGIPVKASGELEPESLVGLDVPPVPELAVVEEVVVGLE
jgi:hypothetical protein